MRSLGDEYFILLLLYVNDVLCFSNHLYDVNELNTKLGWKVKGIEELINFGCLRKAMFKVFRENLT